MVCGHGGNDFVSESMNKLKQKAVEMMSGVFP